MASSIPIPPWLLVHTATIAPYQAWGVFGPPRSYRCFWSEAMAGGGTSGTERTTQLTLYLAPGADCPPGSRITHPDGREGYASAVAHYDGGGLPVPDHTEVAVIIGSAYGPAFGETVIIVHRHRTRTGGVTRIQTTHVPVDGAAVRLVSQSEQTEGEGAPLLRLDTVEVVVPPGTEVSSDDQIIVRGLTYDVDGTPAEATDSATLARPGVKIIGRRRY